MYSRNIERLEQFWHNLVLISPSAKDVNGAVVACNPEIPMNLFNHAANISVNEDEAEKLLSKVTKYFVSKASPHVCFRVSPLTYPSPFSSFLEEHGFMKESEESAMVFGGGPLRDKLNPNVKVKELSENELGVWNKLSFPIFEMPIQWKKGVDKTSLEFIRKGVKFYVAYFREKAVGTCALFSSMRTGGIFAVGTQKEYGRRGIGTTLTVRAIMDSIDEGNNLHATWAPKGEYAERFYRRIGFETDHTISWFVKKLKGKD